MEVGTRLELFMSIDQILQVSTVSSPIVQFIKIYFRIEMGTQVTRQSLLRTGPSATRLVDKRQVGTLIR